MNKNEDNESVFESVSDSCKGFFRKLNIMKRGERRSHPRRNKLYIAEIEANGQKEFVNITNLSKKGVGVSFEKELKKGTKVKLTFSHEYTSGKYEGQKIDMVLWAKVRWAKPVVTGEKDHPKGRNKEFDSGLELVFPSKDVKFKYNELLRELRKYD